MLRRFDWILISAVIFLSLASLLVLASISKELFWRQAGWYLLGFLLAAVLSRINWRWLANRGYLIKIFYSLIIGLLFFAYFFAPPIRGVRGWLVAGPFQFQPAELAKLGLILIYAGFFSRRHLEASLFRNLSHSFLYLLPPLFLVAIQPDFGSALILFGIWIGFILTSGITGRQFTAGFLLLAALSVILWFYVLKPYQQDRILSFLLPDRDPLGSSYSVIQAKIAIGSAGFFGKGFGQGSQVQLGFLPEPATDFIFAAFVEEWGWLGGALLLAAFFLINYRIIKIGLKTLGNYAKFICLGSGITLLFQFFFNVGSNLGFSPVVGLTFPFFSYGGSSLLTLFILLGIIQNIAFESSY